MGKSQYQKSESVLLALSQQVAVGQTVFGAFVFLAFVFVSSLGFRISDLVAAENLRSGEGGCGFS
jgi:hypothetical protein